MPHRIVVLLTAAALAAPARGQAPRPPPVTDGSNFGVDESKLGRNIVPRYLLTTAGGGTRRVTRGQAIDVIEAGVPDDASLLRLTVIGPEADRKRVTDDLASHPALAVWRGRVVVQGYAPDHPLVARFGFVTSGSPSIYLQAPSGKVLARNLDGKYAGPDALAKGLGLRAVPATPVFSVGAVREPDPAYNAGRDPDLWGRTPGPAPGPVDPFHGLPVWGWGLAALGVWLLWNTRGESPRADGEG